MAADLRALAGKLGLLKPCPDHVQPCPEWCGRSEGVLPSEAEVRAAIFEAGKGYVEVLVNREAVFVEAGQPRGDEPAINVLADETDDPVLLALLRALEACRGAGGVL